MASDDLTVEFDPLDDDDVTSADILEALKNIKADTQVMADIAKKKASATPMDKNIQTQADTKSKLEEADKYQNANQNAKAPAGDGLITYDPSPSAFSRSPHEQVLEALREINYSILGLSVGYERGKEAQGRNSGAVKEIEGAHANAHEDAQVVEAEVVEEGDEAKKAIPSGAPKASVKNAGAHSPIRNRGTDLAEEKTAKIQNRYQRFKDWYVGGMSDDEVKEAMTKGSKSYDPIMGAMGSFEGLFAKALPVIGVAAAAIGAVGGAVDWGRHLQQDELNQGVGAGGALGNTLSDAGTDIAHKLGLTANTGQDLQRYRQEALSNNWALYSQKADTYYASSEWATNAGLTTQADKNWIQEMTALGLSTTQIKTQFEGLSEVSKQVGVSFQNLSKSVAQEATESEKLFGKQGSQGTEQGEVQVQEADNLYGLQSGTIKKMALTSSGQSAMAQVLINSGHAGQEEASIGSPSEMYADIVKDHLGAQLAKSMMATAYSTAMGTTYSANPQQNRQDQEQAFVRNLTEFYGISASDFKNSGMTAFKEMGNGSLSATSTLGGSLTKAGMASAEKELPTIKTDIQIGLSKGMEAKIANSNGMAQGLFSTEGTDNYFHIQNKWALDR